MSESSEGRYTALVAKYPLKGPHPCLHALWSHQRLAAPEESHCHASLASLLPVCICLLPRGDRNCLCLSTNERVLAVSGSLLPHILPSLSLGMWLVPLFV